MARTKIYLTVYNGRISPGDAYAQEQVASLPNGDFFAEFSKLTASGRDERDGLRGKWFAGLAVLSKNTDDPRFNTPEKAYRNIRLDLGFSRPLHRRDGSVIMEPMSTSNGAMSDEEMEILQELARAYTMTRWDMDPWEMWEIEQAAKKANEKAAKRGRR